jgi:hypothetical protein
MLIAQMMNASRKKNNTFVEHMLRRGGNANESGEWTEVGCSSNHAR